MIYGWVSKIAFIITGTRAGRPRTIVADVPDRIAAVWGKSKRDIKDSGRVIWIDCECCDQNFTN